MIRVSPGVGPPGVFAPAREARTTPLDPGPSFDAALQDVEPPAPPVVEREAPGKREREDAAPGATAGAEAPAPDNAERTTVAPDEKTPTAEAAPEGAQETGEAQGAPRDEGAQARAAEPGGVRAPTGVGLPAGAPAIAQSAAGVAAGPARTPESPAQGATPPSAAPAGSAPATGESVPKGEAAPDEPAPEGGSPKSRGGGFRPRGLDGLPERIWPRQFQDARLTTRLDPNLKLESEPSAAPEGTTSVGPSVNGPLPAARAQEAIGGADARPATGSGGETGAQNTPIATGGEGSGSQAKGDGSGAQSRAGTAVRQAEVAQSSPPKADAGAPVPADGGAVRVGAEQAGLGLVLGRAVGAPRSPVVSAGSAPQADRAGGFEGAVVRGFSAVMRQNGGSVVIRLSPESLGPVRISMSLDSSSVSVMLDASTPKAHELLTQTLGSLRQSLEAQGLRVERMGVTLSHPSPASSGPAADGAAPQRGSEDSGFGDQDAADGRSRGHADQESRDRHGGAHGDPTHPFGTFSELFDSPGTPMRFVATA